MQKMQQIQQKQQNINTNDLYSIVNNHINPQQNQLYQIQSPQQNQLYQNLSQQHNQTQHNQTQQNQTQQNQTQQNQTQHNQTQQNQLQHNQTQQIQLQHNQLQQNQTQQNQLQQNQTQQNQLQQNQLQQNQLPQQNIIQNNLLIQMMEQQKFFQEEIIKLKDSILNQNSNSSFKNNIDYTLEYQDKINELDQYKQVNNKLQDRIVELQNQLQINITSDISDPKISQLQKVKEETIEQINKLKKVQEDISQNLNLNKELESNIKKIISENISTFENSEEIILIENQSTVLLNEFKNITSIELKELDLPFNKYNINDNNNKLYFILTDQIKHLKNNIIKLVESDTANIIDSEYEVINILINQDNILELSITMGNYSIDNLCNLINQYLLKYDINMVNGKNTNLISFKSKNKFDLHFGVNTLLYSLGFTIKNQSKYINSNKYTGTKVYNFKINRCMNIFLSNINDSTPLMQYIITENNSNQSKKIIFNPMINELKQLDFKFIDNNNKEYKFNPDNGLEFGIQLIIGYINSNQKQIKNNINDIVYDDILTSIKQSV